MPRDLCPARPCHPDDAHVADCRWAADGIVRRTGHDHGQRGRLLPGVFPRDPCDRVRSCGEPAIPAGRRGRHGAQRFPHRDARHGRHCVDPLCLPRNPGAGRCETRRFSSAVTTKPPLWIPSRERLRASNLVHFAALVAGSGEEGDNSYESLWRWSIERQEEFWSAVWDWCGIVGDKGGRVFVDSDHMPGARYFPDARLNFAENLLRRRTDEPAIIAWSEAGRRRVVSWRELYDLVSRLAQAMRDAGVGPGDRVAALLPNVPEAVVAMLAATSIGAVFSTASPDFGVRGVIDRFGQVGPRLLFVTDGYRYRGKRFATLERVPAFLDGLPTVEHTIVVPNLDLTQPGSPAPPLPGAVQLDTFIRPFEAREIDFARLPFDHPLYILFSSGTTGVPKCIVHRAGGVRLQHIKEHQLHC
ncbi:MAG: AMP-binding protein, partial [Gemmatimonadetes bacterium]|nr:AMP-binding protein [Gemmatimonadota bacterium]